MQCLSQVTLKAGSGHGADLDKSCSLEKPRPRRCALIWYGFFFSICACI